MATFIDLVLDNGNVVRIECKPRDEVMGQLHGLRIVAHPLATQIVYRVQRHPTRKRRRKWRVVRLQEPGCWQVGQTLYMHPVLIE